MSLTRQLVLVAVLGIAFAVLLNAFQPLGDWTEADIQMMIMVAAFTGGIVAWLAPLIIKAVGDRVATNDPGGGPACFALMIIVFLFGFMFINALVWYWEQGVFLFGFYIDQGILVGAVGGVTAMAIEQRLDDR